MNRRDLLKLFGLAPLFPITPSVPVVKAEAKREIVPAYQKPYFVLEQNYCILEKDFYLIDNWCGEQTYGPNPSDWANISRTEDFPLGTKRMVYDDTNSGWAILMYLYYTSSRFYTQRLCCLDARKQSQKVAKWSCITNVSNSYQLHKMPLAVPIGSMVSKTYGWAWVGGVCPYDLRYNVEPICHEVLNRIISLRKLAGLAVHK